MTLTFPSLDMVALGYLGPLFLPPCPKPGKMGLLLAFAPSARVGGHSQVPFGFEVLILLFKTFLTRTDKNTISNYQKNVFIGL